MEVLNIMHYFMYTIVSDKGDSGVRVDYLLIKIDPHSSDTILIDYQGSPSTVTTSLTLLLKQWCLQHGSTLDGRIQCYYSMLNVRSKACVLVNERIEYVCYFPTKSLSAMDCMLINYRRVAHISKVNEHQSKIIFNNGVEFVIDCSYRIVKKQYDRCRNFLDKIHVLKRQYVIMEQVLSH